MAVTLPQATYLRLKSFSTVRFLYVCSKTILAEIKLLKGNPTSIPKLYNHFILPSRVPCTGGLRLHHHRRKFCTITASSAPSSSREAVEKSKGKEISTKGGKEVGEFRSRTKIGDIKGAPGEVVDRLGEILVVKGWVRTLRVQSSVTFIEVNDGSCLSNLQCVMNADADEYDQVESGLISTGASVCVQGILVNSQGLKQKVELEVEKLTTIGKSDPSFPIQKKRVSREFLRTKAHLHTRTNAFGAVARVRNALAYATHKFFQENGFVWMSSPIITASDCEGAGEQFCVTTLIPSSREATDSPVDAIPKTENGSIDWSQDFFGKPAFLTVSGQLKPNNILLLSLMFIPLVPHSEQKIPIPLGT